MSAVLAVCGEAFCAMVGDGRMVEEPILEGKPKILTEDLPKVRKVNKNVVIGFAGDCLAAVQIINALEDYQTQYLTLEKIVKILAEKGRTVDIQPGVASSSWMSLCWAQSAGKGSHASKSASGSTPAGGAMAALMVMSALKWPFFCMAAMTLSRTP